MHHNIIAITLVILYIQNSLISISYKPLNKIKEQHQNKTKKQYRQQTIEYVYYIQIY